MTVKSNAMQASTDSQKPKKSAQVPLALQVMRTAFKAYGMVSAKGAGKWANSMWFSPRRSKESSQAAMFLADADEVIELKSGHLTVPVYSWGMGEKSVLLVHGWEGRSAQLSEFVAPLTSLGLRVLCFDGPAHGRMPGKQTHIGEFADIISLVDSKICKLHGIVAHSLGCTGAVRAAALGVNAKKIVCISPMANLNNAVKNFSALLDLPTKVEKEHRRLLEARFGQDVWMEYSIDSLAKRVKAEGLLIHDQGDREIAHGQSLAIGKHWHNSTLITTQSLGHRKILRDGEVVQQVKAFFA
ncbi:alpha/beta hydrolase [Pseudomonas sp. J452]|uniref:alpha/beta hydrolase n=1 Tax=Pseudomonas sp. J452 TaxID=2898441 RepID=UPI0021ADB543|nr:alpha/beta hydrolase [Pseudomonas sp. J452]UUY08374.1 alpha/beta hydrolase [Pseudomonas sp. J452]